MTKSLVIVLLSCVAVVLADQTPSCLQTTRESCHEYKQCCSRMCRGGHQATCTESGGRVSQASCRCDQGGNNGGSSPHSGHADFGHGNTRDHSAHCRTAADGSCSEFRICCGNRCGRSTRQTCVSRGNALVEATCHCQSGSEIGNGGHNDGRGNGGFNYHTTPRYGHGGGSHGGLRENMGSEDYTHTCTRNHRDCTGFRGCCQDRCGIGRNIQSECQQSGHNLRNTLCVCRR